MNSTSKFIMDGGNKITSALVKAFDSWKEPYDIRPEGVFGSVAKVISGDVSISSDTLDIEFEVPF